MRMKLKPKPPPRKQQHPGMPNQKIAPLHIFVNTTLASNILNLFLAVIRIPFREMLTVLALFFWNASADEIMKRVAENQDRAQKERLNYIYDQHVKVDIRYKSGKIAAEEVADYTVTPVAKGIERKETAFHGHYLTKGSYSDVHAEPKEEHGINSGIAKGMRDSCFDKDSKDGLDKEFFPLTTSEQEDLRFELAGEQEIAGRKAFRIRFGPKKAHDFTWAGEALIDEEEFQPVNVYTRLSRKLPLGVRIFLGTDVPGLGFNVRYRRLDKDLWFPDSFGTEFRLKAVFFIDRTITVSLENKNFKRTKAESEIHYDPVEAPH